MISIPKLYVQSFWSLQVLELKKGATQGEIKSRYRELSKKWHPDKYQNGAEKEEANER